MNHKINVSEGLHREPDAFCAQPSGPNSPQGPLGFASDSILCVSRLKLRDGALFSCLRPQLQPPAFNIVIKTQEDKFRALKQARRANRVQFSSDLQK